MVLLIDNSNLYAGGGIQVAISFLRDLKTLSLSNEYHVVLSKNTAIALGGEKFPENFFFYNLDDTHEKSIYKRVAKLKEVEIIVSPDCIFTVFGPSYHRSKFLKIVGFAWGYVIYPDSPFYKKINLLQRVKYKFLNFVKTKSFIKNSDALIFETEYSLNYFRDNIDSNIKVFHASNTLNNIFNDYLIKKIDDDSSDKVFNILLLSANYPHKNIDIILGIIDSLKNKYFKNNFVINLSLTSDEFFISDEYKQHINFLGKVELKNLPEIYLQNELLLMPSLLETFSTTYLEAMAMKIPIVASDLPFAHDICRDCAYFCEPTNPESYANAIFELMNNKSLRDDLINKGVKNIKRFGSSMDRTKRYLQIINNLISNNENSK